MEAEVQRPLSSGEKTDRRGAGFFVFFDKLADVAGFSFGQRYCDRRHFVIPPWCSPDSYYEDDLRPTVRARIYRTRIGNFASPARASAACQLPEPAGRSPLSVWLGPRTIRPFSGSG